MNMVLDWGHVAESALGTLLGALIAAFVAWRVYRSNASQRYNERLDERLVDVVGAVDEYSRALRDGWEEVQLNSGDRVKYVPVDWAVLASLAKANLVAKK